MACHFTLFYSARAKSHTPRGQNTTSRGEKSERSPVLAASRGAPAAFTIPSLRVRKRLRTRTYTHTYTTVVEPPQCRMNSSAAHNSLGFQEPARLIVIPKSSAGFEGREERGPLSRSSTASLTAKSATRTRGNRVPAYERSCVHKRTHSYCLRPSDNAVPYITNMSRALTMRAHRGHTHKGKPRIFRWSDGMEWPRRSKT